MFCVDPLALCSPPVESVQVNTTGAVSWYRFDFRRSIFLATHQKWGSQSAKDGLGGAGVPELCKATLNETSTLYQRTGKNYDGNRRSRSTREKQGSSGTLGEAEGLQLGERIPTEKGGIRRVPKPALPRVNRYF